MIAGNIFITRKQRDNFSFTLSVAVFTLETDNPSKTGSPSSTDNPSHFRRIIRLFLSVRRSVYIYHLLTESEVITGKSQTEA